MSSLQRAGAIAKYAAKVATYLAVIGFCATTVVSFVPLWPCSLLEHFRVQLLLGGLLVAGAAAAVARIGWFDAAACAVLVTACLLAPDLARSRPAVGEGAELRVLLLNVLRSSTSYPEVRALIDAERPDVVALVEPDARWLAALAPSLAAYPFRIEHLRSDNFGIALYARHPLRGGAEHLGEYPSLVAVLEHPAAPLSILLTHPIPPVSPDAAASQEHQLAAVARRASELAAPCVVMGDFNATPWSRLFARLRAETGLCDSRAGFGAHTTFPADSTILRIPIDHVLVSCAIGVRDRRIGPAVGSDHLPVIVDLVVPRR